MSFTETLQSITGKLLADCTDQELYLALLELVRQKSADRVQPVTGRKLYYISAEFLIGKLLSNNLINLGLYDEARSALAAAGKRLSDIEEVEPEPSLGNGGLGRLAACFLDSLATLNLPGDGIGLRYHFGLFHQSFADGLQNELPDPWLNEHSWAEKTDITYPVTLAGKPYTARLYKLAVTGYEGRTNTLNLFDLDTIDESIVHDGIAFDKTAIDKNLTLFLYPDDSDEAGQKATRKAINILGKTTLKVRIIHMTGGKDPDEIIQKFGAEGFKRCLDSAANDVEFSLLSERSKYDISSPAGRSDYLKAAAAVLASLNSPVELDIYISRLSEEFSVNKDAVAAQVKIERAKRAKKQKNEFYREVRDSVINQGDKINKVNTQRSKALRAAKAEEILIASFMSDPELYRKLESKLTPELFVTDFNRRVFSAISERIKDGRPVGLSFLASEFTPEEISVIARIETVSTDISNSVRECEDCINVLKKEKNRHIDVKPSEMSDEDFMKLFK